MEAARWPTRNPDFETLMTTSAFHVQLCQGAGEGGIDCSDFFVGEFIVEAGFGAAAGFFYFGLVNVVGGDGHIGEDGDVIAHDFDESFAHGEKIIASGFANEDFARDHLSHQRDVLRVNAQLALDSRQGDHLNVFGIDYAVGGYNFKF